MRGQALLAAAAMAAALVGTAGTASAQQYRSYHDQHVANQTECQASQNRRTVGGAIIGGLAGALLGREVADRGVRGEGAGLGAVVGAVAGGALGRSTANCDRVAQYDPYAQRGYNGYAQQDPYYNRDEDDLYGGPYQESGYYGDDRYGEDRYGGRDCRMGEVITRDPYGREYSEPAMMCRGRDGQWRPQ